MTESIVEPQAEDGLYKDIPVVADRRTGYFWARDELFDKQITSKAKLVYLAMCRRANKQGTCWPAYPQLSKDAGYSEATIRRAIKELVDSKLVIIHRRKRPDGSFMSNQYLLVDFDYTPLHSDTTLVSHRQEGTVSHRPDKEYPGMKEYPIKEKVKLSHNPKIAEMQKHLGFPDKTDKDPVPNPVKEAMFIMKMGNRGFDWDEEILPLWIEKVTARREFVSMQWVNEDIGKEHGNGKNRQGTQRHGARKLQDSIGRALD